MFITLYGSTDTLPSLLCWTLKIEKIDLNSSNYISHLFSYRLFQSTTMSPPAMPFTYWRGLINWHKWINGRIDELWWVDKMCMHYVCVIVICPETCLNYTYVFDGCRQIILWLCKEFGLRSSSWSVNDDECGLWENYKWINVRFISPLLMDVCLIVEWENCVLCFNV